jgi:hypothetical protein
MGLTASTTLEELPSGHSEYQLVVDKMRGSIKEHNTGKIKDYNIVRVEKIHNREWERKYRARRAKIQQDSWSTWWDANERWLFHGTDKLDLILSHGFDVRHASPNGMFGPGDTKY